MSLSSKSIILRKSRLSPYIFTFLAFIVFVICLYCQNFACIVRQHYLDINLSPLYSTKDKNLPFSIGKTENGCDVFTGKWVWDPLNRPLYQEPECHYIQPQLTCQKYGRPDRNYQFWRWQPHGCSLPSALVATPGGVQMVATPGGLISEDEVNQPGRVLIYYVRNKSEFAIFNALLMLETLRNKRMMFVGDSLNRGQYVSMVCLLQSRIQDHAKSMKTVGSLTVFTAKEYNATIEFYWAPFLLESNSDDAVIHRITDRVVRKGSINKHGKHWEGVDIIVFNTYLWWMTGVDFKILHGLFDDEVKEIVEVSTKDAYRMAMKSMSSWVRKNMDSEKTRVFFAGMSPSHQKSIEWGGKLNENCYNQTQPIEDPKYWGSDCNKNIMKVIEDVFKEQKFPITFLNITQLSLYRKDAHTSIYKKQWNPLTPEQIANPTTYADCTHWCLPGLQDTWNELLFAKLFYP